MQQLHVKNNAYTMNKQINSLEYHLCYHVKAVVLSDNTFITPRVNTRYSHWCTNATLTVIVVMLLSNDKAVNGTNDLDKEPNVCDRCKRPLHDKPIGL